MEKTRPILENSNCSIRKKILIYDAIIKSKLLYVLESAQMNQKHRHRLDVFHRRGLRK